MRQAFHIFGKDMRRFRFTVVLILLLTAGFAWFDAQRSPLFTETTRAVNTTAGILSVLLPVAWLLLIVSSIHEECLAGDRQDWLTRPYSRLSLLAAKLLLIATAVFLPLLAADIFIAWRQGLSPFGDPAGLAGRYAALALFLILPAVALAAVTANLAQATIATLGLAAAAAIFTATWHSSSLELWGALQWLRSLAAVVVLAAGAVVIVVLQYRYRATLPARSLGALTFAAALLLPALLPWKAARAVQSRLLDNDLDPTAIRVTVSETRFNPGYATVPDVVLVDFELSLSGMGEGVSAWIQRASARLKTHRGAVTQPAVVRTWDRTNPHVSLPVNRAALAEPVEVELTLFFILAKEGMVTRMPPGAAGYHIPGVGVCTHHISTTDLIICRSPWRSPNGAMARLEPGGPLAQLGQFHTSPFPTIPAISPLRFATAVLGTRYAASSQVAIAALQASTSFERRATTTISLPAGTP